MFRLCFGFDGYSMAIWVIYKLNGLSCTDVSVTDSLRDGCLEKVAL